MMEQDVQAFFQAQATLIAGLQQRIDTLEQRVQWLEQQLGQQQSQYEQPRGPQFP